MRFSTILGTLAVAAISVLAVPIQKKRNAAGCFYLYALLSFKNGRLLLIALIVPTPSTMLTMHASVYNQTAPVRDIDNFSRF